MKRFFRLMPLVIVIILFLASTIGCGGTKTTRLMDWQNLHRVGPDTVARVYYWEEENQRWVLSDDKYGIPEGHFIGPPPSVDD